MTQLIHIAITSANRARKVEEDEKCSCYHEVSASVIAIRKNSQTLTCWVSLLAD